MPKRIRACRNASSMADADALPPHLPGARQGLERDVHGVVARQLLAAQVGDAGARRRSAAVRPSCRAAASERAVRAAPASSSPKYFSIYLWKSNRWSRPARWLTHQSECQRCLRTLKPARHTPRMPARWQAAFLASRASGSVFDSCVSLLRFSPWKSTVGFPWIVRRRLVAGLLVLEALERSPRLDQRPIDGEMVIAHQVRRSRLLDDQPEKAAGHIVLDEPLPVLGRASSLRTV